MDRSIRLRLNDIIRAIDGTEETIGGIGFDTFQRVFHMPRTVERCIEIVSEATRHVPVEMKARYPDIHATNRRNRDCCGMTTIYDDHITWDVAKEHFPRLRAVVVEMLAQLPPDA